MTFATDMQAVAQNLVGEFGETVGLVRAVQTAGADPFAPTVTEATAVEVSAVVSPVELSRVDNSAILAGDLVAIIAGPSLPDWLDTTSTVDRGGLSYKVAHVRKYPAQGLDAAAELILRR